MDTFNNKEYQDWRIYHDFAVKFACEGCSKNKENCINCNVLKDDKALFDLIPANIQEKINYTASQ